MELFNVIAILVTLTWWVLGWFGMALSYIYCLLFGALISPTDPIAVLGILKTVGVPKSLEAKITGESLFNDGVGIVIFLVILEVTHVIGTDITERRQAEEEKEWLLAILEATPDFVGIADTHGNPLYLNGGGRKMLGVSLEDLKDHQIFETHPEWARAMAKERFQTAIRDGREIPVSLEANSKPSVR